jgi:SMP-30/Gluconolactonase/LRE-like region
MRAESHGKKLNAFDIAGDGGLSNRRVWAALDGFPGGICIDAENAVWVRRRSQQTLRVCVCEGGKVLQTVELDRGCFACILRGEVKRTLFLISGAYGRLRIRCHSRVHFQYASAAPSVHSDSSHFTLSDLCALHHSAPLCRDRSIERTEGTTMEPDVLNRLRPSISN